MPKFNFGGLVDAVAYGKFSIKDSYKNLEELL